MATRVSTQLLDSITEESVLPVITPQFEEKPSTWNWLMKGEGEDVNTRGCRIPFYAVPSASNGFYGEGASLPSPVADEDGAWRVRYTRYGRAIEITWDALREMEKKGSLLKGVMARVTRHSNSAFKFLNKMVFGTGTGTLGVPQSVASTTITYAHTTLTGGTHGSRNFLKNARIQHISSTGAVLSGGMTGTVSTVTSIDRSAYTVTYDQVPNDLTAAIGVGTCFAVYAGSYNKAFRGFGYHNSNGNESYQTVLRSDYPDTRSTIVHAAYQFITVALFRLLDQEMKFRAGDEDMPTGDKAYIMNPTQIYEYELLGYSMVRSTMSEKTLDLGFKKHTYNGETFMEDVDADFDKIWLVHREAYKKFESRQFGPLKEGSGFWRDVPAFESTSDDITAGTGTHKARVRGYIGWDGELGCVHPGLLGLIDQLGFKEMGTAY